MLAIMLGLFCTASADPLSSLGRGVNLGNAFEAPAEGEWGMEVKPEYIARMAEAGFRSIRLPVRWSAHAAESAPYTIEPAFFQRIDEVIGQALKHDLSVVLNCHHYDELMADPAGHRERFLSLWDQVADHYRASPPALVFELLNEPHQNLNAEAWNELAAAAIARIRAIHPDRMLMVGSANWNSFEALDALRLPDDDRRIIVTFHYYLPFHFTHQGAEWVRGPSRDWLGTEWKGTVEEQRAIAADFDRAAAWARAHDRPLYLGEFGVYQTADGASRVRWTAFVREAAEQRGIAWAYWEFGAGFGIYDRDTNAWRKSLLHALLPPETETSN
jgi:endoglucanase